MFFHDGVDILPELAQERILSHSIVYFTFSWFASEKSLKHVAGQLRKTFDIIGESGKDRIRFLLNSHDEYRCARSVLPEACCVLFNNSAFINENSFRPSRQQKIYDTIYNARPNAFKRHELTVGIKNKAYIAYDWKVVDIDLNSYGPSKIFRNMKGAEVPDALSQAKTGLMLSSEEGACYASLEYLLCGLPVISTESVGGRDEFYNESNSLICQPSAIAVAEGVRLALDRLADGTFAPDKIRFGAILRMNHFRNILQQNLSSSLQALGEDPPSPKLLSEKINETNKLWKYRNMRIKKLAQVSGTT